MTRPVNPFAPGRDLSLLRLVVAWRSSPSVVQARQVTVKGSVQAELVAAARRSLELLKARTAVPYTSEATFTKEEWARVSPRQLDPDSAVLKALDPLRYPLATAHDLAERQFLFFAYVAGAPGNEIVFVTKFNPTRGLRQKKVFRFIDDVLTEIDEPVLAFNPDSVDLVYVPGQGLSALDVGVFEFLLRDAPEIVAKTPKVVADLGKHVPFAPGSADELAAAALANSRTRRRLLAVVERGHLAGVTVADIRKAFTAHKYKASEYVQGGKVVVTAANAAILLQVLNEDVLIGPFSNARFAAERKAPA